MYEYFYVAVYIVYVYIYIFYMHIYLFALRMKVVSSVTIWDWEKPFKLIAY
jgi:hypothetical protein